MKQKSDKALPSKFEALMSRWEETKDRSHLIFELFLKETSIFNSYEKEMGRELTMDMINTQLSTHPPTNDKQYKEPVCPSIQHHGGEEVDNVTATAV